GSGQTRLTDGASDDYGDPSWSPDGHRIAFPRVQDGSSEIYVMNADGTDQTNITETPAADEESPVWSPDGSKVAFSSDRDGNPEIYVANADGSSPVRLTDDLADDFEAAWSPDGSRIAFFSTRDTDREVYVMNADGSGETNITDAPGSNETGPAWSPDGSRILFRSNRDGDAEIYVMNADGTSQVRLTAVPGGNFAPAWQPVPVPSLSVSNARVKEGKRAAFTVTLVSAISASVTYDVQTEKGKAKPRKDFKPMDSTLTFAPGETSQTVKVKTKNDAGDERKETFFLDVSYPGGPSDRGRARITDND
ncbi:MAG: DPP IV N-terminal domain-containing protein, partial [Actinomycetota bacterium]|nr:DPP IV N-terminal domain-containing protein [Actinomycetota bacterium]